MAKTSGRTGTLTLTLILVAVLLAARAAGIPNDDNRVNVFAVCRPLSGERTLQLPSSGWPAAAFKTLGQQPWASYINAADFCLAPGVDPRIRRSQDNSLRRLNGDCFRDPRSNNIVLKLLNIPSWGPPRAIGSLRNFCRQHCQCLTERQEIALAEEARQKDRDGIRLNPLENEVLSDLLRDTRIGDEKKDKELEMLNKMVDVGKKRTFRRSKNGRIPR